MPHGADPRVALAGVLGVSPGDIRVRDRAEEARARGNQEANPDADCGAGRRVCGVIEQRALTSLAAPNSLFRSTDGRVNLNLAQCKGRLSLAERRAKGGS